MIFFFFLKKDIEAIIPYWITCFGSVGLCFSNILSE